MASRVWERVPGGTETIEPIVLLPGSLDSVVSGPTTRGAPITRDAVVSDVLRCEQPVLCGDLSI